MIVFDLRCTCGCQFEGWFANRCDFDGQVEAGRVTCPRCGGACISKILSPVAMRTGVRKRQTGPAEEDGPAEMTTAMAVQFLRSVQEFVEEHFVDVGPQLAAESLKIHYGVAEPRNIRGVATPAEEKMLEDEGIELVRIPLVKKSSGTGMN